MLALLAGGTLLAQQRPIGAPVHPWETGPFVFDTAEQHGRLRLIQDADAFFRVDPVP